MAYSLFLVRQVYIAVSNSHCVRSKEMFVTITSEEITKIKDRKVFGCARLLLVWYIEQSNGLFHNIISFIILHTEIS